KSSVITTTNAVTPFFQNISIEVASGEVMRLAFFFLYQNGSCYASIPFTNQVGGPIFSAGGVDLLSGNNNISNGYYGSGTGATNIYHFLGSITFEPVGFPCEDTLESARVLAPDSVCPNRAFELKAGLDPSGLIITGATHQ